MMDSDRDPAGWDPDPLGGSVAAQPVDELVEPDHGDSGHPDVDRQRLGRRHPMHTALIDRVVLRVTGHLMLADPADRDLRDAGWVPLSCPTID
jgi:hypothetical protein